jgi:hypothetical protein
LLRDQQQGPKDLKQVWFPGVRCDVGGGYLEAESGLSKVALEWMLDEAQSPLGGNKFSVRIVADMLHPTRWPNRTSH